MCLPFWFDEGSPLLCGKVLGAIQHVWGLEKGSPLLIVTVESILLLCLEGVPGIPGAPLG